MCPTQSFAVKGKQEMRQWLEGEVEEAKEMLLGVKCWLLPTVHPCRGTKKTALLVPFRRAYRLLPGIIHYTQRAGIILSRKYNARE